MKVLSLLTAISIGAIAAADAAHVKTGGHYRSASKQQIALKLFGDKDKSNDESESKSKSKADKKESKKDKNKESRSSKSEASSETKSESKAETKTEPAPVAEKKPVATPVAITPKKPIPVATVKPSDTAPTDAMPIDSALMSVLRDIDKALRESEEVPDINESSQHAALAAALQTLDIALDKAQVSPNRIVHNDNKGKFEKAVTAESWESGDVELPNGTHASLNVVWAKKVNGLVNITITGNCGCRPNYAGERVGEWVVVLNGKSTLDTGFDIQSQSNVNFWLGKLNNFNVDASTCTEEVSTTTTLSVPLKALNTAQRRQFFAEAASAAKKSVKEGAASKTSSSSSPIQLTELPPARADQIERKTRPAPILEQVHMPSATAHILGPRRAIAGEYITVSVVDADGKPEPFVELNFNDSKATTNASGKVTFQVPEDSAPGPSLSISLTGRSPEQVYILQPLIRPSATDVPRIDKWNIDRAQNTITIEGHNFDGIAENNRVILDARKEATIRFSSPVELQAHIADLQAGGHDVIIQRNGMRSEPISLPEENSGRIATKNKKKS